jgi:hypothetical protein
LSITRTLSKDITLPVSDSKVAAPAPSTEQSSPERQSKPAARDLSEFAFIPKTLAVKCRRLIETHHVLNGYGCLPEVLWHEEFRDFVETNQEIWQIFKRASAARSAKKANEGFVLIASTILSLELLANDFSGWSARFPAEKMRAIAILQKHRVSSRTRLMDFYSRPYLNPAVGNLFSPDESGA